MEAVIYGAGRLGRAVLMYLADQPSVEVLGFIDDDPAKKGTDLCGLKVIGCCEDLPRFRKFGVEGILVAVADGPARLRLICYARDLGFQVIGARSGGSSLSTDARLGEGCILSNGALIEDSASLGAGCFVGTGAVVKGSSDVPDGSNIPAGATITASSFSGRDARSTSGKNDMEDLQCKLI